MKQFTGNYLVDSGLQEQMATPVGGYIKRPPYVDTIKQIKQPQQAKTVPEYKKFGFNSQQELDLMQDVKKQGGTAQDAQEILEQFRTQKTAPVEPVVEEIKEEGVLDKFNSIAETPGKIVGAGISQIPKIVSNIGGFFIGKPIDTLLEKVGVDAPSLEEQFKQDGIESKERFQEVLGIDPDAFTTSFGEFGSEIGALFLPGGQAKLVSKFPQSVDKIRQLGTAIEKAGAYAPKTFKLLKSALTGAKEVGKFEVVSEGEVTPEGLAIGAVANPVIGGVAKVGKGIVNKITKDTPEKLIVSGLVNPADLRNASERLAKLTGKDPEIADVSKWLLNKGVKGGKDEIREQISAQTKQAGIEVQKKLAGVKGQFDDEPVKSIQEALLEKGRTYMKKVGDDLVPRAGSKQIVSDITRLGTKSKLTVKEMDEATKILGKDLFNKGGDLKDSAAKEGWQNAWVQAKKFIEEKAPGVRALNKDLEVGISLNTAIARKEARELSNQIAGYIGFGAGVGGIGGFTSGQDIESVLKGAIVGGGLGLGGSTLKNFINSSEVKSRVAQMLNSMGKKESTKLKEALTEGGMDNIPKETMGALRKALNALISTNID